MTVAYLTVDDAPSSTLPETLSVLDSLDVPTLLFCEGQRLVAYPDHARQAIESGVHLGNHAYSHTHASELSVSTFREELERTESLIESVYDNAGVGRPAKLFRFPYGDRGGERAVQFQTVLEAMEFQPPAHDRIDYEWYHQTHADMCDWFWTIEVEDWNAETIAELRSHVGRSAQRLGRNSADIILFHDSSNSPAMFEAFVEILREYNIEFGDPLDLVP